MPEGNPPLIGDFSGPAENGPREDLSLPNTEKEAEKQEVRESLEREHILAEAKKEETAQDRYLKQLEDVGLGVKEAREIMAEILANDVYRETHHIGPQGHKIECVIRSRAYADIQRAYRYLEAEKPTYPSAMNDFMATYNVAASLEKFANKTFRFPDPIEQPDDADEAFQERLNFLKKKNSFLLSKLTELVSQLDNKLLAVFSEGAPEDF